nr:hypothetical protein [Tanacetum cinerariifolium]
FDTMLVHQGEGSRIQTEPHHTPSPEADPSYHTTSSMPLSSIPTAPISPVTQTETTPIWQYTRRARIAQSSSLPTVADEPASLVRAPMVTSPVAAEGSMQPNINELTALCTSLQRQYSELLAKFQAQEVEICKLKDRVKVLEDIKGVAATQSGDDAPIKGRSIDEREAATERISDDSEELARVLTSIDATTVLAGGIDIPTASGFIPTAGPPVGDIPTGSDDIPTASPVFATANVVTLYSRRKGKEVMAKSDTPKKQRDAEVARIHAEEELQGMIDSLDRTNETIAKSNLGWKVKDFKGMTFEEIEAKFNMVWKQVEDFILMGSKEEAERHKRKGIRFDQESSKKLKSSKEVIKDVKSTEEIPEEKIKEIMQLTQNFMHAPVEWKLYDLCGVHQVTAKDKDIFMLVEKDYPLRKGLAIVMISYKLQVKTYSMMANELVLKIYKIASTPRQQGD